LRGCVYKRDSDGNLVFDAETRKPVVRDFGPDAMQVSVAQDVLDRIGVHDKQATEKGMEINVNLLLGAEERSAVRIQYADGLKSEQERALSRERVRTAIEQLFPQVVAARKMLDGGKAAVPKRKCKRKKKEAVV